MEANMAGNKDLPEADGSLPDMWKNVRVRRNACRPHHTVVEGRENSS